MKTSLRAYFLQNGFNYGNYQGLGYANVLYPALRKMYKDDDDKLQEALKENIEFFNTNIHFLPFITSLHLVMLENKTPSNEIRNIKMALMGPLAGIGDSLAQFCLAPLFATIGASLAQDGLIMGPILFFVAMNVILLAMKLLTGMWGYKLGTNIIATLSTKMEQISNIASMIGVTVISGLAVNFVKISTPIQYVANMPGRPAEGGGHPGDDRRHRPQAPSCIVHRTYFLPDKSEKSGPPISWSSLPLSWVWCFLSCI